MSRESPNAIMVSSLQGRGEGRGGVEKRGVGVKIRPVKGP